jgi:hypothetical protein
MTSTSGRRSKAPLTTTIDHTDWCRQGHTQRKVLSTGFLHQQPSAHPHRARPVASRSLPISAAARYRPNRPPISRRDMACSLGSARSSLPHRPERFRRYLFRLTMCFSPSLCTAPRSARCVSLRRSVRHRVPHDVFLSVALYGTAFRYATERRTLPTPSTSCARSQMSAAISSPRRLNSTRDRGTRVRRPVETAMWTPVVNLAGC